MSLVNTKKMFQNAYDNHYSIGAFNVNNMEMVQAITSAAKELSSPIIIQASSSAINYAGELYLKNLVEIAEKESSIPVALHLDHGKTFEICKKCIDTGFTSVMIDGSSLDYEQNIELTSKVTQYAHKYNVSVEAELGSLAGVEDEISVSEENSFYTDPAQVKDFVQKTNVDSLAVAIGTSHGAFKFKPGQNPQLRFDILEKIQKNVPSLPIVLHGASCINPELIKKINMYGGNLKSAIGIPEDQLREASKMAVCKINVDSDLRLAMTGSIREFLYKNPEKFDPRGYLSVARDAIKDVVKYKLKNVFGCAFKV